MHGSVEFCVSLICRGYRSWAGPAIKAHSKMSDVISSKSKYWDAELWSLLYDKEKWKKNV